MRWFQRHFERYRERQPWDFCWRIGAESTAVSLVTALLLAAIVHTPKRAFLDWPMPSVFILLVLIAPPVETLMFQAFPIFIVRMLKGAIRVQILISTLVFSAVHFPEGITTGLSAGVIGGLYFAFAYAHWRAASGWQAFWITTGCHAIHNGIVFILLLIFRNWS